MTIRFPSSGNQIFLIDLRHLTKFDFLKLERIVTTQDWPNGRVGVIFFKNMHRLHCMLKIRQSHAFPRSYFKISTIEELAQAVSTSADWSLRPPTSALSTPNLRTISTQVL